MWIGKDILTDSQPFGNNWPKTPIKALGIFHSSNKHSAIKANSEDKTEKLIKHLHWWKARNLSLSGKILIVKTLSLSKFALPAFMFKINTAIYIISFRMVKLTRLRGIYLNRNMKLVVFKNV